MSSIFRHCVEKRFITFGHLVYQNHWIALCAVLLLVAGLTSQVSKIVLDTSTEGFLHNNDPILLAYNAFREQFGRDELVLLTVEAPDVFDRTFLEKFRELHDVLYNTVPYLDDITSLINARNTQGKANELIVDDLLKQWPEDELALKSIKTKAMANPLYRHLILNDAGTITTILLKTDAFTRSDSDDDVLAGFDDVTHTLDSTTAEAMRIPLTDIQNSEIVMAVRTVIERYQADDFRIFLAGTPVVTDELKRSMQANVKKFLLMAVATIALLLFLLFRRISGVLMPLLTVVLSLLSTLGIMGLAGIPFKLPTQILPSFLLAVGVGASIHLLAVFFRHLQTLHNDNSANCDPSKLQEEAITFALGHSGPAIVMTSLTTAAGLASFATAKVAPISDLGVIAALGVLISLLYTLVLLPALFAIFPLRIQTSLAVNNRHGKMDRLMRAIANFSTTHSKPVLIVSLILVFVAVIGITNVRFSHKPYEWLPASHPVRQATNFVNENMRGSSSLEVVVNPGRENSFYEPAVMQGLETLSHEVAAISHGELFVGKSISLADVLKEINQALNEGRKDAYIIPQDRDLIAQEFLLFENSGSDDLEDFVDSRFSKVRFTVKMPLVDSVLYSDFIDDLMARFQRVFGENVEITVTGIVAILSRTIHASMNSMMQSYVIAALVIFAMMILFIGNLRLGLISMIPNLTPIVFTLGLMGWLHLPLDLFTMLIGSIAIGLTVDDTIHFMHNYRRYHDDTNDVAEAVRQTLLTTGQAMLVTTVVLSVGFFLYLFADLSILRNFGLLTGATIIFALLADFFLAPALLAELDRPLA